MYITQQPNGSKKRLGGKYVNLSRHSLASQFSEVSEEAADWTFETLLEWAKNAARVAHRSGQLNTQGYNLLSEQMCRAALQGQEAMLQLLWSWYVGFLENRTPMTIGFKP